MDNFDVFCVAKDTAQSMWGTQLQGALTKQGEIESITCFGKGGSFPYSHDTIRKKVQESRSVVIFLGNDPEPELVAAKAAIEFGKKLIFYVDGASDLHLEPYRTKTDLLIYTSREDTAAVKKLFPTSKILRSINPLWEDWGKSDILPRTEVRRMLGIEEDIPFFFFTFDKYTGDNFLTYGPVLEAIANLKRDRVAYRVLTSFHPGDNYKMPEGLNVSVPTQELQEHFHALRLTTYRQFFGRMGVESMFLTPQIGLSTRQIVPGADVVIGAVGTDLLQAVAFQVPALSRRTFPIDAMLRTMHGTAEWLPYDKTMEGAYEISRTNSARDIVTGITYMLSPKGRDRIRRRQEECLPSAHMTPSPYVPGTATESVANAILALLK